MPNQTPVILVTMRGKRMALPGNEGVPGHYDILVLDRAGHPALFDGETFTSPLWSICCMLRKYKDGQLCAIYLLIQNNEDEL